MTALGGFAVGANHYDNRILGYTLVNSTLQTAELKASLVLHQGAGFDNEGIVQVTADAFIGPYPSRTPGEAASTVTNRGLIVVDILGDPTGRGLGLIHGSFESTGEIQVDRGGLWLGYTDGQATISGPLTAVADTNVYFFGDITLTPAARVTADSLMINSNNLHMTFDGTGPIFAANHVTVSGHLNIETANDFTIRTADSLTVIDNRGTAAIDGNFSGETEGAVIADNRGNQYQISYVGGVGNNDIVLDVIRTTPVVTVNWNGWTYDGTAHPASGSVTGSGGVDLGPPTSFTYYVGAGTGGAIGRPAPSDAGTYTVVAHYAGSEFYAAAESTPVTVTVRPAASLSGFVYEDLNNDGQVDSNENGIAGVTVRLQGTDDLGHTIDLAKTTDGSGLYQFDYLSPGCYTISETQPAGYAQGTNAIGTAGGSVAGDVFSVCLHEGVDGMNYNYGERPPSGTLLARADRWDWVLEQQKWPGAHQITQRRPGRDTTLALAGHDVPQRLRGERRG